MAKLRKMLCDINSPECTALMRLIETQSQATLASWAIQYAKDNYLGIYETQRPQDSILRDTILSCEEYLAGSRKLAEVKPLLTEAGQTARGLEENPIAQAAARAVSTACAAVRTPTNALGFLFYGSAAVAYSQAGLEETIETYNKIAEAELKKAFASLQQVSIPDEPHPAKIKWNC